VPVIVIVGSFVVFCFLVWGLTVPFLHPRGAFVKVALSPQKWVWIEFGRDRFRCAEGPEQLARAPFHQYGVDTRVPEVVSPSIYVGHERGPSGVEHPPGLHLRPGWGSCQVSWVLERRGTDDATWSYAFQGSALSPGEDVEHSALVPAPPNENPALALEVQLKDREGERNLDIVCRVASGEFQLQRAMQGGHPVLAHVAVRDPDGKVLADKDGELSDFGHT